MKIVILYTEDCPYCEKAIEVVKRLDGCDVEFIDADSEEGRVMVERYGVKYFPTTLIFNSGYVKKITGFSRFYEPRIKMYAKVEKFCGKGFGELKYDNR